MNFGIDTFGCDHGRSGPGSYVQSLVRNVPETAHTLELFGPEIDRYTYNSGQASVAYRGLSMADSLMAERVWHLTSFPSFARKSRFDAVLFPSPTKMLPLNFAVPSVVMVQDIVSELYRDSDDAVYLSLLKGRLRTANHIIAASNFIRDDLVKQKINESRITVVHHGIDTSLFYPREYSNSEAVLIHPFSIRRPYIIYASRVVYPGKCHVELIRGFNLFKEQTRAPHRLVLAGADGVNADIVHREVITSPWSSDILLTGYFPHQNLPELYAAADACIFPSASEGVGLPVLEAMASGIPVACSSRGALPEIAGDAALYFDQNSPEEIASAISSLVRMPGVSNETRRSELTARALEHIKKYSWQDCAARTVSVLESVCR